MSLFRKERVSFCEKGTRAACVFVDVGFVVLFPHMLFFDDFSTHENHPLICLFEGLDETDADSLRGMSTMGYARAKNIAILDGHCNAYGN